VSHQQDNHLSAEQLQAFLEGELPARKRADVEAHVAGCLHCSGALDGWRALFGDLDALPEYRPSEGFAERVMIDPRAPGHVPAGILQEFLEGSLAVASSARVEGHLAACSTCNAEVDAWLAVMRGLDDLEALAPSAGFADDVMSRVERPVALPLVARVAIRLRSLLRRPVAEHVPTGLLQDLADGALPATAVARVEAHVGGCVRCARELHAWRTVVARMGSLERLEPPTDFGERVMLGLRTARALQLSPPLWARGLAAAKASARRLVPETRQALAALSGVAVTPMVVLGVLGWALASHPALTLGSLASFVWWQATEVMTSVFASVPTLAQSNEAFGLDSLYEALAAAPAMVVGGALLYSSICAFALRVLYKNLFANRPSRGRYAHVSIAS